MPTILLYLFRAYYSVYVYVLDVPIYTLVVMLVNLSVVVYTVEQGLIEETEFISACVRTPGYQ